MRVLVVGTGSIGRRHMENLRRLGAVVAAYSERASQGQPIELPSGVERVDDFDTALASGFDAVVVANRTDLHVPTALSALSRCRGVFIEKPLSLSLDGVQELVKFSVGGAVIEAGFMLRMHPNLRWISGALRRFELGELFYARAVVGQWLPDWRPGTDYRQSYSAKRGQGGGVILDLIHEIDVMRWLLGEVSDVSAMTSQAQSLCIETESVAQVGMRFESGVLAQVSLDYVRPGYARTLEVVGAKGVYSWDYVSGVVTWSGSDNSSVVVHRVPLEFERNTMFLEHMAHFLHRLQGTADAPVSSIDDSVGALRIALAAHKAAELRRNVHPADI